MSINWLYWIIIKISKIKSPQYLRSSLNFHKKYGTWWFFMRENKLYGRKKTKSNKGELKNQCYIRKVKSVGALSRLDALRFRILQKLLKLRFTIVEFTILSWLFDAMLKGLGHLRKMIVLIP